jgi:hypothetical protein
MSTDAATQASIPCDPNPGSAMGYVEAHGYAEGLLPGRIYHFRAVAVNANGAAFYRRRTCGESR